MVCKFVRNFLLASCLACSLSGCSIFNSDKGKALSPSDTIVGTEGDDEKFLNETRQYVANSFDDKKTEYNYTQSDVIEAIYFNFDDSNISREGVLKIQDVAKMVKKSSSLNILVVGNCDKFGTEKYNYNLGRRRADAVRDVFISAGIDKDRIVTASLGSCKANKEILNKSEGKNDRRCDIVLLK